MSRFQQRLGTVSALAAVLAAPLAQAQDAAAPFGECRLGGWSSTRNLDQEEGVGKATCFVNWKQGLGENLRVNLGARIGVHDRDTTQGSSGRVREAYVEGDTGALRWRLGRQIIAWGRADRINPTDNLSPRDYTALVPEDEEQRIGIDAAAAQYRLSDALSVTAVLVPRFEPHRTPVGTLPPNRRMQAAPDNSEWAFKLEKSGGSWDGSLSYYDGFDRFARYHAEFPAPGVLVFAGSHERMRAVGADVASTVGSWGVRAEFSASRFSPSCALCAPGTRSVQRLVVGIDRDVGESGNINAQMFRIKRSDYVNPEGLPGQARLVRNALDRLNSEFGGQEYGVSLRLFDRYWNDRLKAEIGAIFDISSRSRLIRPRITYSISDSIKATAGLDYFDGGEQSYFGSRARNRLGFVELAYVF